MIERLVETIRSIFPNIESFPQLYIAKCDTFEIILPKILQNVIICARKHQKCCNFVSNNNKTISAKI